MKIKKLSPFILAFVLAGCVPIWSLHPLYDDKHIVFDEKLLGTFEANDATWEFTRAEEPNAYQLLYSAVSEEEKITLKGLFSVHLVKLDNHFFLDVYPKQGPWGDEKELNQTKWPFNSFFMMPVHTFIKVEILESELKIRLTDDDNLKKLLKADPNAVKHELVEGRPVLTASSSQLQPFVLKHADDDQLFNAEVVLTRKISAPVQDANKPKTSEPNATDVNAASKDHNEMPV